MGATELIILLGVCVVGLFLPTLLLYHLVRVALTRNRGRLDWVSLGVAILWVILSWILVPPLGRIGIVLELLALSGLCVRAYARYYRGATSDSPAVVGGAGSLARSAGRTSGSQSGMAPPEGGSGSVAELAARLKASRPPERRY